MTEDKIEVSASLKFSAEQLAAMTLEQRLAVMVGLARVCDGKAQRAQTQQPK